MLRSPLLPRLLLIAGVIALLLMLLGVYQFVTATNRYNELSALPAPTDLTNSNQAQLMVLAQIALDKTAAENARGTAIVLIGAGVVLLGAAAFIFARIPDTPPAASSTGSVERVQTR